MTSSPGGPPRPVGSCCQCRTSAATSRSHGARNQSAAVVQGPLRRSGRAAFGSEPPHARGKECPSLPNDHTGRHRVPGSHARNRAVRYWSSRAATRSAARRRSGRAAARAVTPFPASRRGRGWSVRRVDIRTGGLRLWLQRRDLDQRTRPQEDAHGRYGQNGSHGHRRQLGSWSPVATTMGELTGGVAFRMFLAAPAQSNLDARSSA